MDLKIDPEFKNLIFPLSEEEYKLLEKSLKERGYNDGYPIFIWNNTILDGHNRYEICQKHGIDYKTKVMEFSDKHDAINWIIDNQLGRRNLTFEERASLIGRKYNNEKKVQRKDYIRNPGGKNQYEDDEKRSGGNSCHQTKNTDEEKSTDQDTTDPGNENKTAEIIAKQVGVSAKTVRNYGKYDEAINTIAENSGMMPQVLRSEIKMSVKDALSLADLPSEIQKEVIESARKGNKISKLIKDAIREEKRKKQTEEAKHQLNESVSDRITSIRIENSDCFSYSYPEDFKADLIITDIPYNYSQESHFSGMDRQGVDFGEWDKIENYDAFMTKVAQLVSKSLSDKGSFYIFCSLDENSILQKKLESEGLNVMRVLFWKKNNPIPLKQNRMYYADVEVFLWGRKNGKNSGWTFNLGKDSGENTEDKWSAVFTYPVVSSSIRLHPTQKPVELIKELILNSSMPGEMVFDPFAGSGSTAIASLQTGRKFLGIDADINYCGKANDWILREHMKLLGGDSK